MHRYGEKVAERPRLTIFVHPDALYELGEDAFHRYTQRLAGRGLGRVHVHWMYSDGFFHLVPRDRLDFYSEVRGYFQTRAALAVFDMPKYEGSFGGATLDWIANNVGGEIVIGGGYLGLCVNQTREHLEYLLGEVLLEQGISVRIDPAICFRRDFA